MVTGGECDAALISNLMTRNQWEKDIETATHNPDDLTELFADIVLEELKFLHTKNLEGVLDNTTGSNSPPHKQAKISANLSLTKARCSGNSFFLLHHLRE